MNIIYVTHEKVLSGASRSLIELIDEVIKYHKVFVLTAYRSGEFIEYLRKSNIERIYCPFIKWRSHFRGGRLVSGIKRLVLYFLQPINLISARCLCIRLRKLNIDIIHSNTSVEPIGALLAKYTGIRHICHIREFGEEDFNMQFVADPIKCYEFLNNYVDRFIFVSKAIALKYRNWIPASKSVVIYDGVGEAYCNIKSYSRKEKFQLLIASRVEPAKRQTDAIEAIRLLVDKGYDNIRLIIAGGGDYRPVLTLIEQLHLDEYIECLGNVENLKSIRQLVDIELVCSKMEAFGRVTIEAMLSGNPVIGSNSGGTGELIIDGLNGYLYTPGNIGELAEKIEFFICHPDYIEKIGLSAYQYASSKFLVNKSASKVLAEYEKIIDEKER